MARKLTGREADTIIAALNGYIHILNGNLQEDPDKTDLTGLHDDVASNGGRHPMPTTEFVNELLDAFVLGEIEAKRGRLYRARLFGEAEDGKRFGIWEGLVEGFKKSDLADQVIANHFDDRLRTASVKPVVQLELSKDGK